MELCFARVSTNTLQITQLENSTWTKWHIPSYKHARLLSWIMQTLADLVKLLEPSQKTIPFRFVKLRS